MADSAVSVSSLEVESVDVPSVFVVVDSVVSVSVFSVSVAYAGNAAVKSSDRCKDQAENFVLHKILLL